MLPHLIPPYSPQPLARRSGPGGAVWFPRWLPATVLPLFTFFDFPYLFYPQGASDGVEGFLYLPVVFLFNTASISCLPPSRPSLSPSLPPTLPLGILLLGGCVLGAMVGMEQFGRCLGLVTAFVGYLVATQDPCLCFHLNNPFHHSQPSQTVPQYLVLAPPLLALVS